MTQTLYCLETGRDDGVPLVLLHGFGGSHHAWRGVIDRLAPEQRVIAYDLPGHGGSLGFPGKLSPKAMAAAIAEDFARRGIARAHLAGHSMGGAICTLIAAGAPELAASLTLFAPGGYTPRINGPLLRRFGAASDAQALTDSLAEMSAADATVDAGEVERQLAARARPGQMEVLTELAAAITRDDTQGVIPASLLSAIPAPFAIAWGTEDTVLPPPEAENLPANIRFEWIEGAGHMLPEESPDRVAGLLREQVSAAAAPSR